MNARIKYSGFVATREHRVDSDTERASPPLTTQLNLSAFSRSDTLIYRYNFIANYFYSFIQRSGKVIDRPIKFIDRPIKFLGRPIKSLDRSIKFIDRPIKSLGRPIEFIDRPIKFIDRPIKIIWSSALNQYHNVK
jgi:hypothetical protein